MERKRPLRVYMQFEMTDEDVFHTFTRDEWFSEVWSNSYEEGDDDAMYEIVLNYDPMDPRVMRHPELRKYTIIIYDPDAITKYPYIKRAIEHNEIKKSWQEPEEEEVTNEAEQG